MQIGLEGIGQPATMAVNEGPPWLDHQPSGHLAFEQREDVRVPREERVPAQIEDAVADLERTAEAADFGLRLEDQVFGGSEIGRRKTGGTGSDNDDQDPLPPAALQRVRYDAHPPRLGKPTSNLVAFLHGRNRAINTTLSETSRRMRVAAGAASVLFAERRPTGLTGGLRGKRSVGGDAAPRPDGLTFEPSLRIRDRRAHIIAR